MRLMIVKGNERGGLDVLGLGNSLGNFFQKELDTVKQSRTMSKTTRRKYE